MFGANIKRLWGSPEFKPYMKELLEAAHSGAKQGFPLDVLKALLRLEQLHGNLHPDAKPQLQTNEDFQKLTAVFPLMAGQLDTLWGGVDFAPYVSAILKSSKGDNGAAFPFETLMALHALIEKHNKDFAGQLPEISLWAT
jgi:hypothetical protein